MIKRYVLAVLLCLAAAPASAQFLVAPASSTAGNCVRFGADRFHLEDAGGACATSATAAPASAHFYTSQAESGLSNEVVTGTGVQAWLVDPTTATAPTVRVAASSTNQNTAVAGVDTLANWLATNQYRTINHWFIQNLNAGFTAVGPITHQRPLTNPAAESIGLDTVNPITLSANNTNDFLGLRALMSVDAGGFTSSSNHNTAVYGFGYGAGASAASVVNKVTGIMGVSGNQGAGTVTQASDFYARPGINNGGGTVTNHYVLYDEGTTIATNNYGFSVNGESFILKANANVSYLHFKDGAAEIGILGRPNNSNDFSIKAYQNLWLMPSNTTAGVVVTNGMMTFGGTGAGVPGLVASGTTLRLRLGDASANAPFEAATLDTDCYTIGGTLPAAGSAGRRSCVTNQLTACAAAGAALTGGGAVTCPVFDNGSAWVGE